MVIKSRPWCVITAHKVIKRLPCRAGTLEPGDWGPRSVSHPGPGKPQCPQVAGGRGLALSCLEVEQLMSGWLGAGMGEPGREDGGDDLPSPEDSSLWQPPESQQQWSPPGAAFSKCLWGQTGSQQQAWRGEGRRGQEEDSCLAHCGGGPGSLGG